MIHAQVQGYYSKCSMVSFKLEMERKKSEIERQDKRIMNREQKMAAFKEFQLLNHTIYLLKECHITTNNFCQEMIIERNRIAGCRSFVFIFVL